MSVFQGFSELPADQAAAVQTALTQVAKDVEAKFKENPHAEQDAKETMALNLAYDALDFLIEAPGPVDYGVKTYVTPHLPAFFRWIAEQLHKLGIFQHAS